MLEEVLEGLGPVPGGRYIDGTAGGGGHTEAILTACGPAGRVLAIDRDPEAVARVRERLRPYGGRGRVVQGNFADIEAVAAREGFAGADGVVLDLGLSSWQLDEANRGFGIARDGPLDMRMDPGQGISAAEWLAGIDEEELAGMIWRYGEDRNARRIARAIVRAREEAPIRTTSRLAEVVAGASGGRRGRIHPATRTFQALRIAVNRELEHLATGVEGAMRAVRPGGRVVVISFHSLEDRIVKRAFAAHAGRRESLPAGGERWLGELPAVRRVWRGARTAGEAEIERNPRARSAKARAVERRR